MKAITMILILFSVAFVQCEHKHEDGKHAGHNHEASEVLENLALDNGKKWKADAPTYEGLQSIDTLLYVFSNSHSHEVEGYHQLSKDISDRLKGIFKGCKMEGAAHDQLHIVLHSINEDVKGLADVKDDKSGHHLVDQTLSHVKLFYDHFEKP